MKKIFLLSFVVLSTLFLTACSYSVNFILVNDSNAPIEIEYESIFQLKTLEDTELQPYQMNYSDLTSWFGDKSKNWKKLSANEYSFDAENQKCKITLAPGKALKILSTNDMMYFIEDYDGFEITKIKLTGKNGVVIFEGNRMFTQFEELNFTNRFIKYRKFKD